MNIFYFSGKYNMPYNICLLQGILYAMLCCIRQHSSLVSVTIQYCRGPPWPRGPDQARISNPVSGGQCHLIHLTILGRFSWLSLAQIIAILTVPFIQSKSAFESLTVLGPPLLFNLAQRKPFNKPSPVLVQLWSKSGQSGISKLKNSSKCDTFKF